MRWAALLKSINAGKNVAMADLRAFVEAQGMEDVKTLLASGNVVFTSDARDGATLEKRLHAAARKELGLDTDWFLRGHAELKKIADADPFPKESKARANHVQVLFHHDVVDKAKVSAFADHYDGPERLRAIGRELYVDYPEGIGRSKLTPAMAKAKFPKAVTARNWNTLLKLVELTG